MLLKDYQQVSDLDQTIMAMHKQLTELYDVRSKLFTSFAGAAAQTFFNIPNSDKTAYTTQSKITSESSLYDIQASFWKTYGIKLPAFRLLKNKLIKANELCLSLNLAVPQAEFEVITLPPSSLFNHTAGASKISFSSRIDAHTTSSKSWKVFVISGSAYGVAVDNYVAVAESGGVTIGGRFMPGLTSAEYVTYASVSNNKIDTDSWSVIIRDIDKKTRTVPCVMRNTNGFSFDIDSIDVMIGENHFRPAMEVR